MDMTSEFDVVQDIHVAEKLHVLEGAGDSQFGDFMGLDPGDLLAFKEDPALFRVIKAVDAIQQTGFSGPVGPDNGEDLSLFYPGADPGKGIDAPEGQGNIVHHQLVVTGGISGVYFGHLNLFRVSSFGFRI